MVPLRGEAVSTKTSELRKAIDELETLSVNSPDTVWHLLRAVVAVVEFLPDHLDALEAEVAELRAREEAK